MMGKANKLEPKLFYHGVSLERRIPKDHPLRKIKQLIDFTFVHSQVESLYGKNGNESIDPAVILKMMLLLFYENIKSERHLASQLPLRLDWLWFCDYDIDDPTPNHSVISKARNRWGVDVFARFFENILTQCVGAGLVDGQTIYVDSSTIDANASKDTLRCQFRAVSQNLYKQLEDNAQPPQKLDKLVSTTDPDARLFTKRGKTTLGYKDHRAVDDKHNIVTATLTTPANVTDEKVLTDVITEHQANTGIEVKTAVADKAYGTGENYKNLYQQGITPCIGHHRKNSNCDSAFNHDKFVYDKECDCYICPAGNQLKRIQFKPDKNSVIYKADRKICQQCQHFEKCVTGKSSGRQIQRNVNEQYIEWADHCMSPYQRKRLMARRKHKAEGSFADAANNHGFKRSRFRGIEKVQIQNLLIAAIQNLRKLLACISRKPAAIAACFVSTRHLLANFSCRNTFFKLEIFFQPNLNEY